MVKRVFKKHDKQWTELKLKTADNKEIKNRLMNVTQAKIEKKVYNTKDLQQSTHD